MTKCYRFYAHLMALFVTVLLISNVASSKILNLGVFTFDGGTLLFPVSYIFGDVLTEVYGYQQSRQVIWIGFMSALLMSGVFALVGILPPAEGWDQQEAYQAILGVTPRIVLASLIAYLCGEFANSYTLAKMKLLTRGRWLWTRTIGSTVVGQFADTFIALPIAFAGVLPWPVILLMCLSHWLAKILYEALVTPLTYWVVNHLKRTEHVDTYDYDTNFNPLRVG